MVSSATITQMGGKRENPIAMEQKQPTPPQLAVELPHSDEAERALLRLYLTNPSTFYATRDTLTPDCFHDAHHKAVFRCISAVAADGTEISLLSVWQKAQAINEPSVTPGLLADITSYDGGGNDEAYLCSVLNDLRTRRTLWLTMQDAASRALSPASDLNEVLGGIRKQLDDLSARGQEHITSDVSVYRELCQRMADNRNPSTRHDGTPVGFDWFDSRGGFQPSDLIIVAAESSQGKTSFALSVGLNARLRGCKISYYSLEMSKEQLCARLLAMQTGVPSSRILTAPLSDADYQAAFGYASDLASRGDDGGAILLDDRPLSSVEGILGSIRMMRQRYGISGAVVDFLQRLTPPRGMSREAHMGESAQKLKNLARELGVWIMALSQLSRDRDSPVPNINRLRDSGQIAEASDITILLYRPEAVIPFSSARTFPEPFADYDPRGHAMVTIAKGRNVGTGAFLCGFDAPTTHFFEKPLSQIPRREASTDFGDSRFSFR